MERGGAGAAAPAAERVQRIPPGSLSASARGTRPLTSGSPQTSGQLLRLLGRCCRKRWISWSLNAAAAVVVVFIPSTAAQSQAFTKQTRQKVRC